VLISQKRYKIDIQLQWKTNRKSLVSYQMAPISMFFENTDFSRLQAVTYSVKVVVSEKWHKIDRLLLHTTKSKYHTAYQFVSFPMTLNDLKGHSPIAQLFKCNSSSICATFHTVSTD